MNRRQRRNVTRKTGKVRLSYPAQKWQASYSQRALPAEMDVQLKYTSFNAAVGAGTTVGEILFNPNSYIPQNSGTEAAAGFVQWASLYDMYRVTKFHVRFTAVNQDTTTVVVVSNVHNETQTGQNLGSLSGNPRSFTDTLGSTASGSNRCIHNHTATMKDLVGSPAPDTDDTYRAIINANPADVVWAICRVYGTGTMTNGVSITAEVTQFIRFYTADLVAQSTAPAINAVGLGQPSGSFSTQKTLDLIHANRVKRRSVNQQ